MVHWLRRSWERTTSQVGRQGHLLPCGLAAHPGASHVDLAAMEGNLAPGVAPATARLVPGVAVAFSGDGIHIRVHHLGESLSMPVARQTCSKLSARSAQAAAAGDPSGGVAAVFECVVDGVMVLLPFKVPRYPEPYSSRGSSSALIQSFNIIWDNPHAEAPSVDQETLPLHLKLEVGREIIISKCHSSL